MTLSQSEISIQAYHLSGPREVALKLAPIVYLHPEDPHRPASVEWYLQRCCLLRGIGSISSLDIFGGRFGLPENMSVIEYNLSGESLAAASSSTQFGGNEKDDISIFPNSAAHGQTPTWTNFNTSPMSDFTQETLMGQPILNGQCNAEAYVNITTKDDFHLISYYFFYPYNGGMGPTTTWGAAPLGLNSGFYAHIGDWETITAKVRLDRCGTSLLGITYEAHGDRIIFNDSSHTFTNRTLDQITPIEVYSAWHSHSSRPSTGVYPTDTMLANDYTDAGPEWHTDSHLVFISNHSHAWVRYNGLWGANITVGPSSLPFQKNGPQGPAFHSFWIEGEQWYQFHLLSDHLTNCWEFNESSGLIAYDSVGGVNGTLSTSVVREAQGHDGLGTVHINGSNDSFITFGKVVGQFGTKDFTVTFWFQTSEKYRYFDLIGNRTDGSHGNFLSIRMTGAHESQPEGMVIAEVDEDSQNYIALQSSHTGLNDGKWHQVAVARNNKSLKLYIDGILSAQGSAAGVANISNSNEFKLGRSLVGVSDKFAPDALYDDLRIYDTSLTDADIQCIFINQISYS